jgi:hypothetical protein
MNKIPKNCEIFLQGRFARLMAFSQRKIYVIGELSINGLTLTTVFQHLQRITKIYRGLKYIIDYLASVAILEDDKYKP